MIFRTKSCVKDIVTLIAAKVKAVVAALATQNSTVAGIYCTETTTEGHSSANRGQRERLGGDDSEPQFFRWVAPPGEGQRLHPDRRGAVNHG